jgi:hypothetical protein
MRGFKLIRTRETIQFILHERERDGGGLFFTNQNEYKQDKDAMNWGIWDMGNEAGQGREGGSRRKGEIGGRDVSQSAAVSWWAL